MYDILKSVSLRKGSGIIHGVTNTLNVTKFKQYYY